MNVNTEQLLHFPVGFARDFTEFVEIFSYCSQNWISAYKKRGLVCLSNIEEGVLLRWGMPQKDGVLLSQRNTHLIGLSGLTRQRLKKASMAFVM